MATSINTVAVHLFIYIKDKMEKFYVIHFLFKKDFFQLVIHLTTFNQIYRFIDILAKKM